MKNKIINISFSLVLTLTIIFLIPKAIFSKYSIDKIKTSKVDALIFSQYIDLDNNGKVEELETSGSAINIKQNGKYLDVYNLESDEKFVSLYLRFKDIDKNGIKEIYFLSAKKQKVFLNRVEYNAKNALKFNVHHIFVDTFKLTNNTSDIQNTEIKFIGENKIIFNLITGFTIQPRKLYTYNFKDKKLRKSPFASINYANFDILSINKETCILNKLNIATNNTLSEKKMQEFKNSSNIDSLLLYKRYNELDLFYKYGDFASYTIAFNENLEFLFPPVEHTGWTNITTTAIVSVDGKQRVLSFTYSEKETSVKPVLEYFNLKGELLKSKELPSFVGTKQNNCLLVNPLKEEIIISSLPNNKISIYNTNLQLLNEIETTDIEAVIGLVDINNDQKDELLLLSENELVVFQDNFKVKTTIPLQFCGKGKISTFHTFKEGKTTYINLVIGDTKWILYYHKNNLFFLKYIIYPFLFVFWFTFIWLVQRINSRRLLQENKTLEKIVSSRTSNLQDANEELHHQTEELKMLNESLEAKQNEIQFQNVILQQQKEEMSSQNEEILLQNAIVNKKNKEITDSINYAKIIQQTILPSKVTFLNNFSDFFIFYKPRDIISGDFFWLRKVYKYVVVAAVDCTGHGVPGAFMSMLGISLLNEIIRKREIEKASDVLDILRAQVKLTLGQTGKTGESKDGMDAALCIINTETLEMQYAGAFNPLYIVRNENGVPELTELKADRQPISIYTREKPFTNKLFQLIKGDSIYMFSDGYADQFGGELGRKFRIRNFKNLLCNIQESPFNIQQKIIVDTFDNWRGKNEQIDDVLVVGLRI